MKAAYKVCPKCGINHSTLVRHRCSKQGEAEPSKGEGEGEGDGEARAEREAEGQGEGEAEGQGEGEGEGQGEGEAEEGEGEAPPPKPPEPEAPPVAVVVTVLKFAALTAASAEVFTKIEVDASGLIVICLKGDHMATATMAWTEFEQRSTVDGEFWAKDVIDTTAREVLEKADAEQEPREDEPEAGPYAADGWVEYDATGRDEDDYPNELAETDEIEVWLRDDEGPAENYGRARSYIWCEINGSSIIRWRRA